MLVLGTAVGMKLNVFPPMVTHASIPSHEETATAVLDADPLREIMLVRFVGSGLFVAPAPVSPLIVAPSELVVVGQWLFEGLLFVAAVCW